MSTPSREQRSLFRRKPVEAFVTETHPDEEGGELSRSIGLFELTMFGVAAIIYFTYSARHSRLARGEAVATEEPQ
jgi:hypothetical protein